MTYEPDFIASELLSELKNENSKKDLQIHNLHRIITTTVCVAFVTILCIIVSFLCYLHQYDFSSTPTEDPTEGISKAIEMSYDV